ncbi:hypothetical protein [Lentilactobacillus kisonensis]|uniref:Uncharacterized protein n=2 Tax=Lentilactobacillus kisonensis TaxID=481722 RepID=H1LI02_9LACO|nr:hypothetical protein [Lentilactobacillus kisonensis]EHO50037.1 hypothetical protein HMPREF9104_02243 [Lentilactobacillus kisonensis F0435]KRL22193.1 hypothetical protein FC98_GL002812 [Lentilactobacillus kisonensis DSM 19906 = JCM 15041]
MIDQTELMKQLRAAFEDYNQVIAKQHQATYQVKSQNDAVMVSAGNSQAHWEIPGDLFDLMTHLKKSAQSNECTIGTLADLEKIEVEMNATKGNSF